MTSPRYSICVAMVRHGDWKMSTNGVRNHVENGGAQSDGCGGGSLLRNADGGHQNASESSLLTDADVCQSTADIQDGGTGADIGRHSSFDDDFIGFDAGHLANADDIVDVGHFSAAIVDGGSSEWLKSAGPDVDAMGKMGLELGVGGDKSVVGDLFSSDNPLTSDIPFSLPDGLSLACPIGKLSTGLCHSSPVSPTNFLDDGTCSSTSTPAARARSHSETENEDRIQTRAFLEELERGSQLTADDKELMETSRKELQAYEFQVLAHDKNNSLLTPQELETLRVHGLEFEESGETGELPPLGVKSETTDHDCQTVVGASFADADVAASSQSDLSGVVQTSLSFLSDPGKETTAPGCPLASCLLAVSSCESGTKALPNGLTAKHSSLATSHKPESLAPKSKPETSSKVRVHKTAAHSKRQQAKPEAVVTKAATLPAISAKSDVSASNITHLVCTELDGKKQMVQLGSTPAVLPSQPPAASTGVVPPKSVGIVGDGTASVGAALPVPGGRNVYLTAVPMLYYKDGCLVIPIQQILTTEHPPDAGMSSCETTAAVAAVSAETTAAAAAAKPADSTSDLSGQVTVSADRGPTQLSLSSVNTGQQAKLTKNPSKQPCQINKAECGDTKKWICNICSQAFPRHYKLKLHYMKHTGEKPFKCSQPGCKWAFTTAFKLKRHEESHLGKKDYVCDVDGCGKKFSTVYNLNTHKKSHSRLCTVECPTCGEKYTTQRQLDYHMRAHGHGKKELTYTCPHEGCGRKFFSRYCMGSHMRVHTHLMKIPCPVEGCKRVFDKRCRLQQHMRSHTGEKPFLCTGHGCGAAFATASKLKRHARKHTGERRWVCEVEGCGKAFLRAEHLRAHRITHTGEKPFQCSIPGCTARFKCKSSLYVHLKRHAQNANKESQDSNSSSKTQRNNKHSNKSTQNQKNNYSRQIQNALGDLFTLINANDLESLINYQVDTTQQVPDSATAATNSMDTLLQTPHTQSVNPSDILSVNQDGLQTILNIDPTPASVQDMVGQLTQQGTTLAGDVLIKDQLRSVINITSSRKADKKGVASAAGTRKGESLKTNKKIQSSQVMGPSTQTIGFSGAVKVEISRTEFPDSTTLSIQEDQVSSTVNNIINPNEVLTSQAITFRDPETGAIYVQTQLLQDDPPNPDIYGDSSNIVSLDSGDQAGLTDFPNIFNDPSHDDLVDPPGVLEFTGTTINLQDLE